MGTLYLLITFILDPFYVVIYLFKCMLLTWDRVVYCFLTLATSPSEARKGNPLIWTK